MIDTLNSAGKLGVKRVDPSPLFFYEQNINKVSNLLNCIWVVSQMLRLLMKMNSIRGVEWYAKDEKRIYWNQPILKPKKQLSRLGVKWEVFLLYYLMGLEGIYLFTLLQTPVLNVFYPWVIYELKNFKSVGRSVRHVINRVLLHNVGRMSPRSLR